MSRYKNYGSQISFLDLLFNALLAFVGFFMLTIMQIADDKKSTVEVQKMEYMITLTWPTTSTDDIDLWVVDPLGTIVYFNNKQDGLMHLDRDDFGNKSDEIILPDGKKFVYPENREIVSIRGYIPGEYVVNVHAFNKRDPGTVTVNVKLEKMNPYKMFFVRDLDLSVSGDEKTVCRFVVGSNGNITSVNEGPYKQLIKKAK
jgi:hypothetical protein